MPFESLLLLAWMDLMVLVYTVVLVHGQHWLLSRIFLYIEFFQSDAASLAPDTLFGRQKSYFHTTYPVS